MAKLMSDTGVNELYFQYFPNLYGAHTTHVLHQHLTIIIWERAK